MILHQSSLLISFYCFLNFCLINEKIEIKNPFEEEVFFTGCFWHFARYFSAKCPAPPTSARINAPLYTLEEHEFLSTWALSHTKILLFWSILDHQIFYYLVNTVTLLSVSPQRFDIFILRWWVFRNKVFRFQSQTHTHHYRKDFPFTRNKIYFVFMLMIIFL